MKKSGLFIMLTVAMLLTSCVKPVSNNMIKADNVTIFYGVSSYAMFGADQLVIDDLLNQFNSLSFKKTTAQMDIWSAFRVNFSCNLPGVRSFWVDKNNVFWLDGETQSYKVSSGSFDYQHLRSIYEASQNTPVSPYYAWHKATIGKSNDKTKDLAKE